MINNFGRLKYYLNFEKGHFYYLQVLRRKKDNPEAKHVKVVRNFYIHSEGYYKDIQPTVMDMCDFFNARAYLRLNIRSYRQAALKTLQQSAKYIANGQFKAVMNSFSKAAGRHNVQDDKLWVIDIDGVQRNMVNDIKKTIRHLHKDIQKDYNMYGTIPTPNGVHLISNPFNRQEFSNEFPNIDMHKDNPTVAYAP